jgi:hypothetical protein
MIILHRFNVTREEGTREAFLVYCEGTQTDAARTLLDSELSTNDKVDSSPTQPIQVNQFVYTLSDLSGPLDLPNRAGIWAAWQPKKKLPVVMLIDDKLCCAEKPVAEFCPRAFSPGTTFTYIPRP